MIRLITICVAVVLATATQAYSAQAVSFSTIEERVINPKGRCSSCHAEGKDMPPLTYESVKGYLEELTEEEILSDEWFPLTYCNGPLTDSQRQLILRWQKAGFPR